MLQSTDATDFPWFTAEDGQDGPQLTVSFLLPEKEAQLAWLLANHAEELLRDPARALELAERAVKLSPDSSRNWTVLGAALYRVGLWQDALSALEKSHQLDSDGNHAGWFFLAMAQWHLDHQQEARRWYDKAVEWMEKHNPDDGELVRFRAEAAQLLGRGHGYP